MTTTINMEADRSHGIEGILHITLEIISLLTGQIFTAVKSGDLFAIMAPPHHFVIPERTNKEKLLQLTNKMVELITGEVPIRCQDVAVYLSVEEQKFLEGHQENYKAAMMEEQPANGSGKRNLSKRSPCPTYSRDSTQEGLGTPPHDQAEDLVVVMVVDTDDEDTCMMEDQPTDGSRKRNLPERSPRPPYFHDDSQEGWKIPRHGQVSTAERCSRPLYSRDFGQLDQRDDILVIKEEGVPYGRGGRKWSTELKEETPVRSVGRMGSAGGKKESPVRKAPSGMMVSIIKEQKVDTSMEEDGMMENVPDRKEGRVCGDAQRAGSALKEEEEPSIPSDRKRKTEMMTTIKEGETSMEEVRTSVGHHVGLHLCRDPERAGMVVTKEEVKEDQHVSGDQEMAMVVIIKEEDASSDRHALEEAEVTSSGGSAQCSLESRLLLFPGGDVMAEAPPLAPFQWRVDPEVAELLCPDCGKSFKQQSLLIKHRRAHTGERPFSCSECGKSFKQKTHLMTHWKTHVGGPAFRCAECGRSFASKANLISHRKHHTGEDLLGCPTCGKQFADKSQYNRHMKHHSGDKPHACAQCMYRSVRRSDLLVHLRTHTGERPYSCPVCRKGFHRKGSLQEHRRDHNH